MHKNAVQSALFQANLSQEMNHKGSGAPNDADNALYNIQERKVYPKTNKAPSSAVLKTGTIQSITNDTKSLTSSYSCCKHTKNNRFYHLKGTKENIQLIYAHNSII